MKQRFKPTQVLEMDLMKSLLQDIKKLKRTIADEIVEDFWINQQNRALYLILKEELQKKQDVNAFHFYVNTLNIAEKTIPDFDETVYEELFELNFDFQETFLKYLHYFKCKKIASIFRKLSERVDSTDFVYEDVLIELEKVKNIMKIILRGKIGMP